jgi:uncharacterized protein YutE (UPF0331/DUF86 family)
METKHTLKNAEKQTAKALRISALDIFNSYAGGADIDDVEKASDILSKLTDGIVIPETLNRIADLLNEIASEAERLAPVTEHEAETTEKLCELVSESLIASYDRHIGRA